MGTYADSIKQKIKGSETARRINRRTWKTRSRFIYDADRLPVEVLRAAKLYSQLWHGFKPEGEAYVFEYSIEDGAWDVFMGTADDPVADSKPNLQIPGRVDLFRNLKQADAFFRSCGHTEADIVVIVKRPSKAGGPPMSQRMFGRRQGITRGAKVFDDWSIPECLLEAMKDECEENTGFRPSGESFLFPYVVGDRVEFELIHGIVPPSRIWYEIDGWLHRHGVYTGEQVLVVRMPEYLENPKRWRLIDEM